jgi:hypothetical protein
MHDYIDSPNLVTCWVTRAPQISASFINTLAAKLKISNPVDFILGNCVDEFIMPVASSIASASEQLHNMRDLNCYNYG